MNRFKKFRKQRGLTHEQVAKLFGVHWRTYYKWEAGNSPSYMATHLLLALILIGDMVEQVERLTSRGKTHGKRNTK